MLGGGAIVGVVLACAWTLYVNVFGASIYPVAAGSGVDAAGPPPRRMPAPASSTAARAPDPQRVSFADRFAPAVAAPLAAPQQPKTYAALLDPTFSLGQPPETFSTEARPRFERRLMALAAAAGSEPVAVASAPAAAAASPMGQQTALAIAAPPTRPAEARPPNKAPSVREIMQGAKAAALANAGPAKPTIFEKLFGKSPSGPVLAYAGSDGGILSNGQDAPSDPPRYDHATAVYDISARTVYMPDGTKLEAHSGLGSRLDDPRFVHERMRGATPPHVYDLTMREALFHGVPALRLNPVGGEGAIFGRTGLLAHTYMLGPNGDSNGCVSFKDYNAFVTAYRNNRVKRLVVVAKLE